MDDIFTLIDKPSGDKAKTILKILAEHHEIEYLIRDCINFTFPKLSDTKK